MPAATPGEPERTTWTFLTNHSHVLMCLGADPGTRLRDIAEAVGITERSVQAIVKDLVTAGYVSLHKEGRRNRYELHIDQPLRHPLECHHTVGEILRLLTAPNRRAGGRVRDQASGSANGSSAARGLAASGSAGA